MKIKSKPHFLWTGLLLMLTGIGHAQDTVVVSTVSELVDAVNNANAGGPATILLNDGLYSLNDMLWVSADQVTVRSVSGRRDAVIIEGQGMTGGVSHIFNVAGSHFTARDMTLRNVANHAVQIHGNNNSDAPVLRNLHILDTYEQMVKVSYESGNPSGSDNGLMEECLLEYSAGIGPQWYIGGIDVHQGTNWIVRDNVFMNIRSPADDIAEHAIHFWSDSRDTLVERNLIINCDRGIGFGLGDRGHHGGIIRNNMIYHNTVDGFADVAISAETAPEVQIYNNTVYMENSYPAAIEYRFAETTGVFIANNLTNKMIWARDGASGTESNNRVDASSAWFVSPSTGDLHLGSPVAEVVDQGVEITGLTDDFDRDARPQGTGIDIGADEYTETPPAFTIDLVLSLEHFSEGDRFLLEFFAENPGEQLNLDAYIILVYGDWVWFWPGWTTDLQNQQMDFPAMDTIGLTILDFTWPEVADHSTGLCFWAACFEPGTFNLVGNVDSECFGY